MVTEQVLREQIEHTTNDESLVPTVDMLFKYKQAENMVSPGNVD